MDGAGVETKKRGKGYCIPPSGREQSRVMSVPGSGRQRQSNGKDRENHFNVK